MYHVFNVVLLSSSIFQKHNVFFLHSSFCILSVFTSKNFLDIVTFCFLHSYLSSFTSDFYEVEKNFGVNDIFRRPFETWNSEIKTPLSCFKLHFHLYFFSWGIKKDFGVIDHQRGWEHMTSSRSRWVEDEERLGAEQGGRMRKCVEPRPLADWGTKGSTDHTGSTESPRPTRTRTCDQLDQQWDMSLCHDELVITILVLVDIVLVVIDQLQNAKEKMQLLAFLECDSQYCSTNLALTVQW